MSGQVMDKPTVGISKADADAEIKRLSKVVGDPTKPLESRAISVCRILDLRREDLLAGVDARVDRVRLMETAKLIVREQADKVVGCTLASVIRSVKSAMLSGLVIDKFKGEVDFIPRARYLKVEGQPDQKIKELWADPNYRGLIHFVANTNQMSKPPFVECVYEGEEFKFTGESDELRVAHTKDPLNAHRAKNDHSKILVVYSRWYLKSGTVDHVMTWQQILEHRDKYSKSYNDAEKYKKYDSFWHKEPIKAALKTLIRDAVNRDKVPISRIDRGYLLDADRADQAGFTDTDVMDAEFVVETVNDAEPAAVEPQPAATAKPIQPTDQAPRLDGPATVAADPQFDPNDPAWHQFDADLAHCEEPPAVRRLQQDATAGSLGKSERGRELLNAACNARVSELTGGK